MLQDTLPPRYDLSQLSILLVDDSSYMTRLMTAVLRGLKVGKVHSASNTQEGWKHFLHARPDIIISDWRMHPLTGRDFLEKVRRDPASPNRYVPFIFLTGHAEREKIELARDTGTHDFLVKPVSARLIYERLINVIENPRPFVESANFFGPDRRRRSRELPKGAKDRRGSGKRPRTENKDEKK
jgi:CheY-like chemotaxis protein